MKKILIFTVLVVLACACEKDYTCTCNFSESYTQNGVPNTTTYPEDKVTLKQVSKSFAEKHCTSFERESKHTDSNGNPYTVFEINKCDLK